MWRESTVGSISVAVGLQRESLQHNEGNSGIRENFFDSFFERSGMCMLLVDPSLQIYGVNQEFCHHIGRSAADLRGSNAFGIIHRSGHDLLRRQFDRILEGRRTRFSERILVLRPGAATIPCQLTAIAIDDPKSAGDLVLLFEPDNSATPGEVVTDGTKLLTALDARILEGIAAGVSTIGLASKYYLSRQGIEYRVGMMLRKMRVPNRAALVSRAYSMGVLSVGVWPPRVLSEYVD